MTFQKRTRCPAFATRLRTLRRRCVGRALRSASPTGGELWLELLPTVPAPPANHGRRLLRVASVIVLDGGPSLFLSIVVQDPHTWTSIGERDSTGKPRQSLATHESTQALGFEKTLDEMSFGGVRQRRLVPGRVKRINVSSGSLARDLIPRSRRLRPRSPGECRPPGRPGSLPAAPPSAGRRSCRGARARRRAGTAARDRPPTARRAARRGA